MQAMERTRAQIERTDLIIPKRGHLSAEGATVTIAALGLHAERASEQRGSIARPRSSASAR